MLKDRTRSFCLFVCVSVGHQGGAHRSEQWGQKKIRPQACGWEMRNQKGRTSLTPLHPVNSEHATRASSPTPCMYRALKLQKVVRQVQTFISTVEAKTILFFFFLLPLNFLHENIKEKSLLDLSLCLRWQMFSVVSLFSLEGMYRLELGEMVKLNWRL